MKFVKDNQGRYYNTILELDKLYKAMYIVMQHFIHSTFIMNTEALTRVSEWVH